MSLASSYPTRPAPTPHSQQTIRLNTVHLSNMLMSPTGDPAPPPSHSPFTLDPHYPFPRTDSTSSASDLHLHLPHPSHPSSLSTSFASSASAFTHTGFRAPTRTPPFPAPFRPSGLSLLLARRLDHLDGSQDDILRSPTPSRESTPTFSPPGPPGPSHRSYILHHDRPLPDQEPPGPDLPVPSHTSPSSPTQKHRFDQTTATDLTPLLDPSFPSTRFPSYTCSSSPPSDPKPLDNSAKSPHDDTCRVRIAHRASAHIAEALRPKSLQNGLTLAVKALPAVVLGSLLNILDGVSCEF